MRLRHKIQARSRIAKPVGDDGDMMLKPKAGGLPSQELGDVPGEPPRLARGGWIKGAIKRPGALHRALKVPQGEKIPASKLAKASHSSNPRLRKEAALAKTLKSFH